MLQMLCGHHFGIGDVLSYTLICLRCLVGMAFVWCTLDWL